MGGPRTIELLSIFGVTSRQWEGLYSPLHGDRLAIASGIRSLYKVPLSPFPPPLSFHHTCFISYLSPVFIITQIRYQIGLKSVTMAPRVAIVFVCDPRRSTRGLLWVQLANSTTASAVLNARPHPEVGQGRTEGHRVCWRQGRSFPVGPPEPLCHHPRSKH